MTPDALVRHLARFTVEPAHAAYPRTTGVPSRAETDHWHFHNRVMHFSPSSDPVAFGHPGKHFYRITDLEGWPGWTFDVPVSWDPDVPLPCPLDAVNYVAVERDGEIVLDEPEVPTGWRRVEYQWWNVAHVPPDEPHYPGDTPS